MRRVYARSRYPDASVQTVTDPVYIAEKFESFERINSIRETNGNFDSCNSCKRLVPSRLHELHESKFPFVSRIEFIRSKLSSFSAHVYEVTEVLVVYLRHRAIRCLITLRSWGPVRQRARLSVRGVVCPANQIWPGGGREGGGGTRLAARPRRWRRVGRHTGIRLSVTAWISWQHWLLSAN